MGYVMDQVILFFTNLLSPEGFPPRWVCGSWTEFHGWLYITSNIGVWSAYMSIPFLLVLFLKKRKDLPFPRIFALFALFIFACGTTHLVDATMFWWPAYRLAAVVLLFTAIVSWVTIFALVAVMPQALKLRSPTELEKEIKERTGALADSEAMMRAVLDSTVDAIITIDEDARVLSFNHAATRLFGYTPAEVIGKNVNMLMPAPYQEEHDGYVTNYIKTGVKKVIGIGREGVARHKTGSTFPVDLSISEFKREGKRIFTGIIRDITERKKSETALVESEARFRRLADSNLLGIAFWEIEGLIYEANDAFLSMFGYTREELEDKQINWRYFTAPDSLPQHEEGLRRAVEGEFVEPYEAPYVHRAGHIIHALVGYALLEGRKDKGVVFMLEVTREKQYQKAREMFLATLTHDLKTPLYGNEKVLHLLADERFGPMTDEQKVVANELLSANRFMARLVDNMLSTHLYEKGLPELHFSRENINTLIEQNRDLYNSLAADKKQHLEFKLAPDLPLVDIDPFEIQRVVNNLVDNAIAFTPVGGRVVITSEKDADGVRVTVEDTGPGMTQDEQAEVFDQYRRYQRKFKHVGVGLGLYLSRLIMESHNGNIAVESEPGKGSRFFIYLGPAKE